MSNLRCHDTTCCHNHLCRCGEESIDVSIKARCLSYSEQKEDRGKEMEFATEIARSNCMSAHPIHCHDQECANNSKMRCTLDNLRIDRINGVPLCVNFRQK